MKNELQKIIKRSSNPKLIGEAFKFAEIAYKDKFRLSGENYIKHALRVALMLEKMSMDEKTIAFDDTPFDSLSRAYLITYVFF